MTGPQLPSATERRSNWAIRSRSWDSRGIGGDTITFTQGTVSGFNAQQAIADRAWIKTDATIAGGNSGGLAANAAGEIIGIPTIAASNEQVDPVDCRVIVDTTATARSMMTTPVSRLAVSSTACGRSRLPCP